MIAIDVYIWGLVLFVKVADGRVLQVPLDLYPNLTSKEVWRFKAELSDDGKRIIFGQIEEELTVEELFRI